MRHFLLILSVCFLFAGFSHAQLDPVKWEASISSGDSPLDVKLIFSAKMEEGWKLYSQELEEGGPIPTTFYFNDTVGGYNLDGKVKELGRLKTMQEPLFDNMTLRYYEKRAVFKQKIKLDAAGSTVEGFLEFMTCDDERCLPPKPVYFKYANNAIKLYNDISEMQDGTIIPGGTMSTSTGKGKLEPVKWDIKSTALKNGNTEVIWTANIQKGWKLYSQNIEEGGPIPTTFTYEGEGFNMVGKTKESGKLNVKKEPLFDNMTLQWYENQVVFKQIFKTTGSNTVTGSLNFMTCDHKRCLPPEYKDFTINLSNSTAEFVTGIGKPLTAEIDSANAGMLKASCGMATPVNDCGKDRYVALGDEDNGEGDEDGEEGDKSADEGDMSLLSLFLLGLGGGLAAVIMPCIYPMIPLTVSFFTKGAENKKRGMRNAILYGLSIIVIFIGLGIFLSAVFGPDVMHKLSTSVGFNLAFFVIFIIFALSFFGMFELTLPSSFVNKADSMSDKGGLLGIFFMAFTLVLVSFSCTVPIVGSILAQMLKHPMGAVVGLFGFSLALALPFTLFAAFPRWLNSMPKSGGWLNTVKVVFGFVELAFAFKFLSNADLVKQWGLLKYEPFMLIWILIALLTGLYLLGVIKFPKDGKVKLGIGRVAFALVFLVMSGYLSYGLFANKNLSLISGFPPPKFYSYGWFKSDKENLASKEHKCPVNLNCHKNNYDDGVAFAAEIDKPIMIDFTGWACVNCRRMEENVWTQDTVKNILHEDFVVISLYVDDRGELKAKDKVYSEVLGRTMRIIGDKWTEMEQCKYEQLSQPLYVLVNHEGTPLNYPVGYTPNVDEYVSWLNCGIEAFEKSKLNSASL